MTRRTVKQLRTGKGDKWKKIDAEIDKMVEGGSSGLKITGAKGVAVTVSPVSTTIATGLTSISYYSISLMTPVTPNVHTITSTPIAGNLIVQSTPADGTIAWMAVGS